MANKSYVYSVGSPTTVSFDLSKASVDLFMSESSRDLHVCWGEEFAKHAGVTVMLSGGLDSQFSALLAKKHCEDVDAVIFEFAWDNTIINAHDVLSGQGFAEAHGIPAKNIRVNVKNCLDKELERLCKSYICGSPQIAVHLYCVEQLLTEWDTSRTLVMGGEIPIIASNNGSIIMPDYRSKSAEYENAGIATTHAKSILPFCMLGVEHDVNIIRDPFCMTPEILFLAHCHNAQVFEKKKKILDIGDQLRTETTDYKQAFYELLVDGLMPPLLKRTGFEVLRYSMAVQTGIYNQFDKIYRNQAVQAVKSRKQRGAAIATNTPVIHGPIQQVFEICTSALETHKPAPCNLYVFDW